jgi:hypothetical protein
LIFDNASNLYGTTRYGGNQGQCPPGGCTKCGTVYQGTQYQDPGCYCGGSTGCGTAFKLAQGGDGSWTETPLWNFGMISSPGQSGDGREPYSGMVFDSTYTNLYGTTALGGTLDCINSFGGPPPNNDFNDIWGCGTVFEISPTQQGWTETPLKAFLDDQGSMGDYGGYSLAGLSLYSGILYGATGDGGQNYGGTFFQYQLSSEMFSLNYALTGPPEAVSGPHSNLITSDGTGA